MRIDSDFEKFHGGPTLASRDRLHVTIGKKGLLYLNNNTHRLLGRPQAVYLHFNRAKEIIAVQPASPRMPEAFPVREKREGFSIHATPFFRHFGICIDRTERFIRPDINEEGALLLELKYMAIATRSPRKRRK